MTQNIFSAHMDSFERAKLARTLNDRSKLSRFSYDDSKLVRQATARNLATKESDRRRLAKDDDPRIRMAVARVTSDPKVWDILSQDEDVRIRRIVSTKCQDQTVLENMLFDEDEQVRINIINRVDDRDMISLASEDDSPEVRKIVAEKTTDEEVLEKLADDSNPAVRRAAEKRLGKLSTLKSSKFHGAAPTELSSPEWSISPYDIESYSEVADEIDEILDIALSEYAEDNWNGSVSVQMDSNDYDTMDKIRLIIYTDEGQKYFDALADDMLAAATSSTNKENCIQNVIRWLVSEFGSK